MEKKQLTAYIAVQGKDIEMIEKIKKYLFNFYDQYELKIILPNKVFQDDWDDNRGQQKQKQAFRMLEGADSCNGLFKEGADIIAIHHRDPAVVAILATTLKGLSQKLIYFSKVEKAEFLDAYHL